MTAPSRRAAAGRERVDPEVLLRAAHLVTIHVPQVRPAALLRLAVDHFNSRLEPGKRPADLNSDAQFLQRIQVNWLRHAATYDRSRNVFSAAGDATEAGRVIKIRTLEAIAAAYPILTGECARQAATAT